VLKLVKTGDFKGENMKKLIVLALFLSVVVLPAFAREATIAELVERAVSKLDRPVPAGFQRMGRTVFINDDGIALIAPNGTVLMSSYGRALETTHEASAITGSFYDFFEENHNWTYSGSFVTVGGGMRGSLYANSGVFAFIPRPIARDDGLIVASVSFARNTRDF
jgi:hypothetical protein